jgi:chemotaxis protein MotB
MSTAAKGKKDEPEKKPRRRIKKVAGHGGHHGGSWKVAYADFVTAMMALFLVLWLLSQADQKLKASVASYFRTAGVFETQAGGILGGPTAVSEDPAPDATIEQNMLNKVAEELKKRVSSSEALADFKDRVKITVTDEGLTIQIIDKADRVTFASGSADLSGEAKILLKEIAQAICPLQNFISIGGHTDQSLFPAGSTYTNWELSADRANAARRALEANCVKAQQVRRVIGYADTELLYPNYPLAAANRRINITVLRTNKSAPEADHKKPVVVEESDKPKKPEADSETSSQKKAEDKGTKKSPLSSAEETSAEPTEKELSKSPPAAPKKSRQVEATETPATKSRPAHD